MTDNPRPARPTPALSDPDRLRLILQNVTDYAIFMIDPRGYVTDWTEGARRVKGYTAEEAIGMHLSAFYLPEVVAAGDVGRELDQAATDGRTEREDWRVRKGGERFWANEIATAVRGPAGALLGFTKITRDLTDRVRVEDALRQAEQRHRLLVENVNDYAIFSLDARGHVATWNPGAQRIFRYAQDEVVGRTGAILFPPEDAAAGAHEQELATAVRDGRASNDRWQMRKDGELFWASGVTSPMWGAHGNLVGYSKVCRDLTQDKVAAEARERLLQREQLARLEAEQAITLKDEFLAVVSHELRTPLTAILLWVKMLQAGTVPHEDLSDIYHTVAQSADALRQLIDDLLDISAVISGKLRLNVREAELVPVMQAAVDAVRPMADAKCVTVDTDLDSRAGRVRVDPDRIQQVVWNLINNAVKFSPAGGRVTVSLHRVDSILRVDVADTGRGIDPAFLPHVFDRFRQADASTTRTHGGLGLGLAICRQLVELHGGTIHAASPGPDRGATFTVELPLTAVHRGDPASDPPPDAVRAAFEAFAPCDTLKGLNVLVVEDEASTRKVVQWVLERCRADVTAVESAAAALAAYQNGLRGGRKYDVVVSDIGMPDEDGFTLLRQLRAAERGHDPDPAVPVVALTAYAREADRERAFAAGFQAHVAKPIEPTALIDAVATAIGTAVSNGERLAPG